jgi:hypothetical protein
MTAKTRMQRRIMGRRCSGNIYSYTLPSQDPADTHGWTPAEKLLFIVLRKRSLELGSNTFELSEREVARLMDSELAKLAAGIATETRN